MLMWFHCRRQHLGHLRYVNNLLESRVELFSARSTSHADVLEVILHDMQTCVV